MWVIVGLGNPGRKYAKTRHNAGFMVVDEISTRYDIELRERDLHMTGKGSMEGEDVLLVEPLTFMNRSGIAVRDAMKRINAGPENLIVIQDDIDMETGILKIRKKGSSGGHKGVESVIREIGTKEFVRVKIGIGRSEGVPVEEYVLGKFGKDEGAVMKSAIVEAADAVETIIESGIDRAMNTFNERRHPGG